MSTPPPTPPMEPVWIALAMTVCKTIAKEIAKSQALIALLEKREVLSSTEIEHAMTSIAPESIEAISNSLQKSMQEEMARVYQEILFQESPGAGPTQ
jgi:hypothetical protein